jgi:hypothetical protein
VLVPWSNGYDVEFRLRRSGFDSWWNYVYGVDRVVIVIVIERWAVTTSPTNHDTSRVVKCYATLQRSKQAWWCGAVTMVDYCDDDWIVMVIE